MNKRTIVAIVTLLVVLLVVFWWVLFGAHLLLPNGRCLDPRLYAPGC